MDHTKTRTPENPLLVQPKVEPQTQDFLLLTQEEILKLDFVQNAIRVAREEERSIFYEGEGSVLRNRLSQKEEEIRRLRKRLKKSRHPEEMNPARKRLKTQKVVDIVTLDLEPEEATRCVSEENSIPGAAPQSAVLDRRVQGASEERGVLREQPRNVTESSVTVSRRDSACRNSIPVGQKSLPPPLSLNSPTLQRPDRQAGKRGEPRCSAGQQEDRMEKSQEIQKSVAKKPKATKKVASSPKQKRSLSECGNVENTPPEAKKCIDLAICADQYPKKYLDQKESDAITAAVKIELVKSRSETLRPKVLYFSLAKYTTYTHKAVLVSCEGEHTADWLKRAFHGNHGVLGGCVLQVVPVAELLQVCKVVFQTRDIFKSTLEFLTSLNTNCPDLKTQNWRLCYRNNENEFSTWCFYVRAKITDALKMCNYKYFSNLEIDGLKISREESSVPSQEELKTRDRSPSPEIEILETPLKVVEVISLDVEPEEQCEPEKCSASSSASEGATPASPPVSEQPSSRNK